MGKNYNHLSLSERCDLRSMMTMGLSKAEIARRLGRHRSTVNREIRRNANADGYCPDGADRRAWARKLRGSKIERSTRLTEHVGDRLAMGWSPELIAGRMELDDDEHSVCADPLPHIFSPAGRRDILLMLHERSTRLTLVRRLHSKNTSGTADAIIAELRTLPTGARKTITHDNGGEFAQHLEVRSALGMPAYFCDPHAPWQRGGVENANGRIRVDLPRKTDLSAYSDADLDDLVWIMNSTPRKRLGFRTPIEAFAKQLGVALEM